MGVYLEENRKIELEEGRGQSQADWLSGVTGVAERSTEATVGVRAVRTPKKPSLRTWVSI